MDVTQLTFGIKDVVAIVAGVISILSFIYAIKKSTEKAEDASLDLKKALEDHIRLTEEKFLHARNSKKANIEVIMDHIKVNKEEVEKKESQIYARLNEVKEELKDGHLKLEGKIDGLVVMQQSMNTNLAELTGFLKATKPNK